MNRNRRWLGIGLLLSALLIAPTVSPGLLLPDSESAPEDAPEGTPASVWSIDDAQNDLSPLVPGTGGVPSSVGLSQADLKRVTVQNEDEIGLDLTVEFQSLKVNPTPVLGTQRILYTVQFQLAGTPVQYYLRGVIFGFTSSADPAAPFEAGYNYAYMCTGDGDRFCRTYVSLRPVLDAQIKGVRIPIVKADLLGLNEKDADDRPQGAPSTIKPGQQLEKWEITTLYDPTVCTGAILVYYCSPCFYAFLVFNCLPVFTGFYDGAPDQGEAKPYTFRSGLANSVLRLTLRDGDPTMAIVAGLNQTIQFTVENQADSKRFVQLRYELEGPEGKIANYAVHGPPSITVPKGEHRNISLALDAKPGAEAGDLVRLVVRGEALLHADEVGLASALLVPSPTLGPERNVLYFHGLDARLLDEPLDPVICSLPRLAWCHTGYMSVQADDPQESPGGRIQGGAYLNPFGADPIQYYVLDLNQKLPTPAALDPEQPIELTLTLASKADAAAVTLNLGLYEAKSDRILFQASQGATLSSQGTELKFSALPAVGRNESILATDSELTFFLEISTAGSPTGMASAALRDIDILAERSRLKLPLIELPEDLRAGAVPSPFQLSLLGDREQFINPGEARLFNVSLLHQGLEKSRVSLDAKANRAGWTVEILPGTEFELQVGESIRLGVIVHAPAEAKEGEVVQVRLNATAANGSIVGVTLAAIATGLDVEDEAGAYHLDEDAQGKLVTPGKDAPGPALVSVLALLGFAAWWPLRRRP